MLNLIFRLAIIIVAVAAVLYQFVVKTLLFDILGYRRSYTTSGISTAKCQKMDLSLGLEGCEDMWLHERTGFLYMACSSSISRLQWTPAFVL